MKTDKELQLALAKMLPEKIRISERHGPVWIKENAKVEDTEWLHVCWLIVCANTKHNFSRRIESRASWLDVPVCKLQWRDWAEEILFIGPEDEDSFRPQQRAIALIAVKEMETHNPTPTNR